MHLKMLIFSRPQCVEVLPPPHCRWQLFRECLIVASSCNWSHHRSIAVLVRVSGNHLHGVSFQGGFRRKFNNMATWRCGCNIIFLIFEPILRIDIVSNSCEITIEWIPRYVTDWSPSDQVMAWFRRQQTTTWANVDQVLWRHMASLSHVELS